MPAIAHTLENLIAAYGVPALFVSVGLESLGAPLPGESAIVLASGAAAAGQLDIRLVVSAAFVAAVLGDNAGYLIGRKLGRPVIVRYGNRVGLTEAAFARTEAVMHRHGPFMVVFARFFVILRQLNGLVAGTTGMPWPTFLAANALGAALWVGVWSTLAYRFGRSTEIIPFVWHHLATIAAVGVPLIIFTLAWLHLRGRRASAPTDSPH